MHLERAAASTLHTLLACALVVASTGCSAWYEGTWESSDELVMLVLDGETATLNLSAVTDPDSGPRIVSSWYGATAETDAGVLVTLQCNSASDPVSGDNVYCGELRLELDCSEEGDDVMSCASDGGTQRLLRVN